MKDLNCFLGNTIAGGSDDPIADTAQHVVTSVPLSALVTLFSCLAPFAAMIFLGFWTVVVPISSRQYTLLPSAKLGHRRITSSKLLKNTFTL